MQELTKVFKNEELGFQVQPIMMDGEPIFLCKEVQMFTGHKDLADSIRTSAGFIEDIDYKNITGDKFLELKDILRRGKTPLQFSEMSRSTIVLTESGLYAKYKNLYLLTK